MTEVLLGFNSPQMLILRILTDRGIATREKVMHDNSLEAMKTIVYSKSQARHPQTTAYESV